jgi:two-component system, OmpR family, sensor kinase
MTQVTSSDEPRPAVGARHGWSVRTRVLVLMLVTMAGGLLVAGALTYSVQFAQLEERVDAELLQERDELGQLAEQGPGGDGTPYRDLNELFFDFLQSSVAGQYEAMMALIDGSTVWESGGEVPFVINQPAVQQVVADEAQRGQSVIRDVRTAQGQDIRLMVTSVLLEGPSEGVLAVGIDIGAQRDALYDSMRTYLLVSLLTLALAALAVWFVSGRLLRPLTDLREATSFIDTDDLTRRVSVENADTDIAQLAVTFNQMLDRLETGFTDQRQFLDDAAHELRTPLTVLRGNLELMDAGDAEDVGQTKDLLIDELDRMQRLVDDLLLLAKAQRSDFVRPAPVDVGDLLDEAMDRVRLLGRRRWFRGDKATGVVQADRQRLLQAVMQLAANAVKFTEPDDKITLATSWRVPDGSVQRTAPHLHSRCLVVTVQDTGQGIAADQVERIFERFGRAENATHVEGSGLGLTIVTAIADAHGGAVTVESIEGLGSTFRLWVPDTAAPTV